jgi:hypothetical protein
MLTLGEGWRRAVGDVLEAKLIYVLFVDMYTVI